MFRWFGLLVLAVLTTCCLGPVISTTDGENSDGINNLELMALNVPDLDLPLEQLTQRIQSIWDVYKINYARNYANTLERSRRFSIFSTNLMSIWQHNREYNENKQDYYQTINEFADKELNELNYLTGLRVEEDESDSEIDYFIPQSSNVSIPKSWDWRSKGAVTSVKNQGKCGSCWAFSAAGSIEGMQRIKKGKLIDLSEQQLLDCSFDYGDEGCDGGLMSHAFDYIKHNHGINSDEMYPYVSGIDGKTHSSCLYKKNITDPTIGGYKKIKKGNERDLLQALKTKGPIAVAIKADLLSFTFYRSGVYSDSKCSGRRSDLNHGVLLVGYGVLKGKPYWIVKNSWSSTWGDQGYIKIARNRRNMCGIATLASYPIMDK